MSVPRTALIVGAGIGGLAAAVALRRAGWHVRVFERAASPRELGFALNLAPNAMAALRELQLAEPLLAEGHVPVAMEFRRTDGRVLRRLDAGPLWEATAAPTVIALRPALHGALLSAIGPDALVLGSEAAGFEVDGEVVELTATDGRAARGDVLIGADGLRSTIRKLLHPNEPPPRRSGYWALRGVGHDVAHHLGTSAVPRTLARASRLRRCERAGRLCTGTCPCSPAMFLRKREIRLWSSNGAPPSWTGRSGPLRTPPGPPICGSTSSSIVNRSIVGAAVR